MSTRIMKYESQSIKSNPGLYSIIHSHLIKRIQKGLGNNKTDLMLTLFQRKIKMKRNYSSFKNFSQDNRKKHLDA